jgi:hypothetical protein
MTGSSSPFRSSPFWMAIISSMTRTVLSQLQDVYEGMERYLVERGINQTFGSDLLNFYGMFERHAYTTHFLEQMKNYCSEQ